MIISNLNYLEETTQDDCVSGGWRRYYYRRTPNRASATSYADAYGRTTYTSTHTEAIVTPYSSISYSSAYASSR